MNVGAVPGYRGIVVNAVVGLYGLGFNGLGGTRPLYQDIVSAGSGCTSRCLRKRTWHIGSLLCERTGGI
jgi:hypothetical protein